MTELRTCAHCGTAEGELTEFNGRLYCPDCLDDLTLVCTDCGSRFLRTHNRSENDDFPICPECYDRDYTRCVRCGRIIDTDHCWYPLDNDDPYCADCCSTIENSPIHDYYFKPYPIFYGEGPRYFGVELEIDDGGECDSSAETLMDIANQSKTLVYCKHDGSLDDGFEIVTYPMSLDCQLHEMPWAAVLDKAISMGYLSHQAGTCGLHVHVSRKAFGDTLDAQDNAIARVLFFVERHWAELLRFSRRTQRQLEQWAARYGYRDRPGEMLDDADLFAKFSKENRTAAQKLLDSLKEFLNKVRGLFTGKYRDMAAQEAYGKDFTELEAVAQKWQEAFDAAERQAERAKTAAGEGDGRMILKDYSYDALVRKPDMTLAVVEDADELTRKEVVDKALAEAKKYGGVNQNGNVYVHVNDTDADVIISAKALRHGLDRRFTVNAPVTLKVGEILQNAVRVNELVPKLDTVDAPYVLMGAAKNKNNEPYIVQFVVNRVSNEVMSVDVLYAINAKTEPAALLPEITGVPATLTGSDLLTYVNRYFLDVLPESVLRHFSHSERPAGKLGEGATAVSGAELCERLFQSTPPRGGATLAVSVAVRVVLFQSTPPRGGRRQEPVCGAGRGYFNPRPREGGDSKGFTMSVTGSGFQSTPPRGGRP